MKKIYLFVFGLLYAKISIICYCCVSFDVTICTTISFILIFVIILG